MRRRMTVRIAFTRITLRELRLAGSAVLASVLCGAVFPITLSAQATPGAGEGGELDDGAFRAVASFLEQPLTGRAAFITAAPMGRTQSLWLVMCDDSGEQARWMTVQGTIGEASHPPAGTYPPDRPSNSVHTSITRAPTSMSGTAVT